MSPVINRPGAARSDEAETILLLEAKVRHLEEVIKQGDQSDMLLFVLQKLEFYETHEHIMGPIFSFYRRINED